MATTVRPAPPPAQPHHTSAAARATIRAVVLWHLLSLDAPSIAALWTWFLAASNHIRLPLTVPLAMAITVWMFYAADRLLDTMPAAGARLQEKLEARHLFHYRHRRLFCAVLLLCLLSLAWLLPQLSPASIRLYLLLGGPLCGYFLLIHAPNIIPSAKKSRRIPYRVPKELAVGVFFAAAIFIPTITRGPDLRPAMLPAALLFALLCSLNCLFIYTWEQPNTWEHPNAHPATLMALRFLRSLTLATALLSMLLAACFRFSPRHLPPSPITMAVALSALMLLLLDRLHRSHPFSPTPLRASADLCLLTPILLLPFLHR